MRQASLLKWIDEETERNRGAKGEIYPQVSALEMTPSQKMIAEWPHQNGNLFWYGFRKGTRDVLRVLYLSDTGDQGAKRFGIPEENVVFEGEFSIIWDSLRQTMAQIARTMNIEWDSCYVTQAYRFETHEFVIP